MINIGIHGGSGRMGTMIYECLKKFNQARASVIDTIAPLDYTPSCAASRSYDELFSGCDVVIDFTIRDGAINLMKFALSHPKPLCIGTTALGE